jgi:DNA-binding transcriptional regulator YiaG
MARRVVQTSQFEKDVKKIFAAEDLNPRSNGGAKMRKKKEEKTVGQKLIEAIEETIENPKSMKVVSRELDIKHLRKMLDMSQSQFAKTYGFNLDTLKKWEQGVNSPDQAVVSYISCIFKKPKTIANIIKSQPDEDSLVYSA